MTEDKSTPQQDADGADDPLTPAELVDEVRSDTALLTEAIGGWRGLLDGAVPTIVFLVAFLVTAEDVQLSVTAALAAGAVLGVIRLARHESLQQVLSGFFGLALSAFIATRTGRSENFFVLGILQNAAYGAACLLSLALRRPLLGYVVSALRGLDQTWRGDSILMRRYSAATWLWTMVFMLRLAVTVPLYLAQRVAELGVAKLVLGWPLYAAAVYVTYRVVTEPRTP